MAAPDGFYDAALETVGGQQWPVIPYNVIRREAGPGQFGVFELGSGRRFVLHRVRGLGGGNHRFAVWAINFTPDPNLFAQTTLAAEKAAIKPTWEWWRVWGTCTAHTNPDVVGQVVDGLVVDVSRWGLTGVDVDLVNPWSAINATATYEFTQTRWALPADFAGVLATALE